MKSMTLGDAPRSRSLADAFSSTLDFTLPPALEAGEPPEARGLARDEVRLMISRQSDGSISHDRFRALPDYLEAGDVVVINTSGTLNAALPAVRENGEVIELHLSTRLPAGLWIVELRTLGERGTLPLLHASAGARVRIPEDRIVTLLAPYPRPSDGEEASRITQDQGHRLWIATIDLPLPLLPYLDRNGFPIRYGYVAEQWPISYYQTVYATEPGSAEMPSAGRAFTHEILTRLVAKGVSVVPLVLHTGVASLEDHEPPYEEYYRVPLDTTRGINAAKRSGRRVIAVGTTVVRALETVVDRDGEVHPGEGWTRTIVTPERGISSVNGLLTGLHEPRATHLAMLEALVGIEHVRSAYAAAIGNGYLWHEFGDLHLILP